MNTLAELYQKLTNTLTVAQAAVKHPDPVVRSAAIQAVFTLGGVANRRFPWDDANTIQHTRENYTADPAYCNYDTNPTTGAHPSYNTGGMAFSPVGSFAPNMYGLYDMAGNARQWCWDIYSSTYFSVSPGTDPRGPDGNSGARVMRGGAFMDKAGEVRCAFRMPNVPDGSFPLGVLGFRCARGL